ncbi:MAG: SBBP repeat-containing protein [Solirubrobacterales bacterium]
MEAPLPQGGGTIAASSPGGPWRAGVAAICVLALGALLAAAVRSQETPGGEPGLQASIAEAPLAFEPNAARTDPEVEYLAHSVAGGSLYLTPREAVLSLPQGKDRSRTLSLGFPGADPRGLEELPGKANSFIGDDPSRWRSGIPTFGRVRYEGVHPGIDLDFYGNQSELEYDFLIAPGADPSRIAVELDGADSLRLTPGGDLAIEVGRSTVRQRAPVAYQEIGGERRRVRAAYELEGSTVGFRLGAYDRSRPLVIDPLVLGYSTYLGGGGAFDVGQGIAVDSAGAAYLTGSTDSTNFPTQDPRDGDLGGNDAFVTKLNPDSGGAVTLAYSTYLGGGASDLGFGIAVDATRSAYVTGVTDSTDFPTQLQYQTDQGGLDVFVAKLNPDSGGAVTLSYSSYLGGSGADSGNGVAIAVDSAGAAYVGGQTFSTDFPQVDAIAGQAADVDGNAFVAKLSPPAFPIGNLTPAYSTYLGGGDSDVASRNSIAVDSAGAAYLSGSTESTDFPEVDPIAGQTNKAGDDAFLAKLDPDSGGAATLAYSTYLGGDAGDFGFGVAVDSAGAPYVTGSTASTDFPQQDPIAGQTADADGNAYIARLNPDPGGTSAATLAYSTYLGGSASESGFGITVDAARAAYVTGVTFSTNFPTRDRFQGPQGGIDAYVTKLNPDSGGAATLAYSTYLGGGDGENANDIAVDSAGVPYVVGDTDSVNFPTKDAFQGNQANRDVYATRLIPPTPDTGGGADTDPPETTIDKGPKRKTKKRKAKFRFSSDEPGSAFFCKLDKKDLAPCDARERFKVKRKRHKLFVQAVDPAGNTDPTPAERKWKVKKKRKKK